MCGRYSFVPTKQQLETDLAGIELRVLRKSRRSGILFAVDVAWCPPTVFTNGGMFLPGKKFPTGFMLPTGIY